MDTIEQFERKVDAALIRLEQKGYISKELSNELRQVNLSPAAKYHTTSALEMPKQTSAIIGNAEHFAIRIRETWIHVTQ